METEEIQSPHSDAPASAIPAPFFFFFFDLTKYTQKKNLQALIGPANP